MKRVLVLIIFVLLSLPGLGADVLWNSRLEGVSVTGGTLSIEDGDYYLLSSGQFVDVSSLGYVRLGLTERMGMMYLSEDTRVRVDLKITPYTNSGTAQSILYQQLEVIYSPSGGGSNSITVDGEDYRMQ